MTVESFRARDALETVSDMIEELWGGLVLAVEDDGQNDDAHKAVMRGMAPHCQSRP